MLNSQTIILTPHHHHNRFTALFPGPPGSAGARRELLDFMVQRKINRGRHIHHPAGPHSIRTNQCPPPPSPMTMILTVHNKPYRFISGWFSTYQLSLNPEKSKAITFSGRQFSPLHTPILTRPAAKLQYHQR